MISSPLSSFIHILTLLLTLIPSSIATTSFASLIETHNPQLLTRDIAIIGGGSSGTYTAISLLDANRSIALIEAQNRLGGHTETYQDPTTGQTTDYGVMQLYNDSVVREYYARLGVELGPVSFFGPINASVFYDFERKVVVEGYVPVDPAAALVRYREAIAKYPFLLNGFVELPDPVPKELLGSVREFLEANGVGDVAELLGTYNQGIGDVLGQTMLYMGKSINTEVVDGIFNGAVANKKGDNSEIYERAREELGESVLLSSRVIATDRSGEEGVRVLVETPDGAKLIEARKLVIAIPPKIENLEGFDLSEEETDVFGTFQNSGYYTGLLKNSGIPAGLSIRNVGQDTERNLPTIPGPYGYNPAKVEGLFDVKYGSIEDLSSEEVQARILRNLKDLREDGVIPASTTSKPEFVRFSSHVPFTLTVSADEIKNGFYKRMNALQGQRHTFYTGAAWEAQDSSLIWRFTKNNVTPRILQ